MSTTIFTATFRIGGVLTDATTAKLSNAEGTIGIKRNDTNAVVVADDTALSKTATGTYQYSLTDPAYDLVYTAYFEFTYGGNAYRSSAIEAGGSAAADGGTTETTTTSSHYYSKSFSFPGVINEETGDPADNVERLQIPLVLSSFIAVTVKALTIDAAGLPEGGGNTTLVAANAAYTNASPTGSITVTISSSQTRCTPVTSSGFVLAAGAPLYLYFTAAGGHSNLLGSVEYAATVTTTVGASTITVSDVLLAVESELPANAVPGQVSSGDALRWVNRAQVWACTMRNDFTLTAAGLPQAIPTVNSTDDALMVTQTYLDALTNYWLSMFYRSGDPDKEALGKAQYHLSLAYQALGVKP